MPSRRHLARIVVMQTLFEKEARQADAPSILERNINDTGGEQAIDVSFSRVLLKGVEEKQDAICVSLQQCAPQWPLDRMDPITRAILLIGGYELLFAKDAPPAVVMNEAIEVAKEFGNEESGKFVNGVLNALAHGKAS